MDPWDLLPQALGQVGPLAFGFLFILWGIRQIFNGNIVPRNVHEDRVRDLQETVKWQRETIKLQAKDLGQILESTRVQVQLLEAIRRRNPRDDE